MNIRRRKPERDKGPSSSSVVKIKHLTRRFDTFVAVNDLSFEVRKGEYMGLMGPNGAGKSTTLKCLTGLIRPTSGSILVHGYDVSRNPDKALANTGCVVETPAFHKWITPSEIMSYTGRIYGLSRYETNLRTRDVLELLHMWDSRNKAVNLFSKGMRQRIALGQALMSNPDFLILDEPTSGLDPRGMVEIRQILRELKDGDRALLISTHMLPEVEELCDSVTMINHGTTVTSGPVEGLVDRMITNRVQKLHVRTLGTIPQDFRKDIVGTTGVLDVEFHDDTHMTISFKGDYEHKADVYDLIFQHRLRTIGFSEEGNTLEDLYMELTAGEEASVK